MDSERDDRAGDRPLRILIALSHFYPTVGGAEGQLLQLAKRWVARGHRVVVLTRRLAGLAPRETYAGIEIRRVIRTIDRGPLFGLTFLASLGAGLLRFVRDYDIVLAGQAPWEAIATGLACRFVGKPSLVRIATTGPFGDLAQLKQARGANTLSRLMLRNRGFVALSTDAIDELQQLGCAAESISLIPNGVDTERFAPPEVAGSAERQSERGRTVLFVGRLARQKNPMLLLDAWTQVNRAREYHLLLAGDGPLRHLLDEHRRLDQFRSVELLGKVDDMPALYRRAAVFALPSLGEGCCNSLLEAMACGHCPVVSDLPANTAIVRHGFNGLVAPSNDVAAWANALRKALTDAELRERLGQAARQTVVANYAIDRVAERYLDVFATVLKERR